MLTVDKTSLERKMSYHSNNLWMQSDPAFLSDGDGALGTSPDIKQKRQPLWDAPEKELFCGRKKQAVGSIDDRPIPPSANANIYLWDDASRSLSTSNQFRERLLVSESFRTFDPADKSISSAGGRSLSMERTGSFKQFGHEPAVNLSISHALEDPLCLNNGIGREIINEMGNSANSFSILMGRSYITGENSELALSTSCEKSDNNFTFQPAYMKEDEYSVSLGQSPCSDGNLISNVQALGKSGDEFVQLGHHCTGDHGSCTLNNVCEPKDRYNCSTSLPYSTEHENFVMCASSFGKSAETFKCVDSSFGKWDALTTTLLSNCKDNVTPFSTGVTYDTGSSSILSMNQSHDAGGTIISFGLEAKGSTGGVINSSDGLLTQSWTTQDPETPTHNAYPEPGVNQVPIVIPTGKMGAASKTKESMKIPVNNFPSNVKSLLSTGILDGVPVKYVSWSREISLRGVIKGTGYLCNCSDCKFSKVVNAYEFERHAGCKTKHPNNHIYFDNGKTIYSVVQELKSTPQDLLFEVIQNVTGSPINQKNFRIWKVSYQAATRELERIYGKDDTVVP